MGKRASQWLQDLSMDLEDIEYVRSKLRFRGAQGATGTQASFMEIFKGDGDKVDKLNEILCRKAGFDACYDISTQTYSRKVDQRVANAICALGATAINIATVGFSLERRPEAVPSLRLHQDTISLTMLVSLGHPPYGS